MDTADLCAPIRHRYQNILAETMSEFEAGSIIDGATACCRERRGGMADVYLAQDEQLGREVPSSCCTPVL